MSEVIPSFEERIREAVASAPPLPENLLDELANLLSGTP